jgi:protein tyrosine phosphatase (PTP) superfamily phosphohydrolase (DUF442 family)
MPISDIQNFLQLSERLYTAGQPFAPQFPTIREAGCTAVINLAIDSSFDAVPEEGEIVSGLGMEYIHIPVQWDAPQPEDLTAFFTAMRRLDGQTLFVHCARNMRVSAFVFLYRVLVLGEPRPHAEADLHKIWQPNQTWQEFIDASMASQQG